MGDPNKYPVGALKCATATALLKCSCGLLELGIMYFVVTECGYGFWKMILLYMLVDLFLDAAVSTVLSYVYATGDVTKEDVEKVLFDFQFRMHRIPDHKNENKE